MRLFYRFSCFIARTFFRIFYRFRVYGTAHFIPGPALIAANHTSFFDPPVLGVSAPVEVHFLARETLFKNPLFGAVIKALNTHPLKRDAGDARIFRQMLDMLKEGKKLVLFPEGTRTHGELGEFQMGMGFLAMKSGAAVIPAYIAGASKIWGRGRSFPRLTGKLACIYGSPISWKEVEHLDRKEAQEAFTRLVKESIRNLKQWYEAGAKGSPP